MGTEQHQPRSSRPSATAEESSRSQCTDADAFTDEDGEGEEKCPISSSATTSSTSAAAANADESVEANENGAARNANGSAAADSIAATSPAKAKPQVGSEHINNKRSSLQSAFPRAGYASLLFSLGNVGLQIFSHLSVSATFLSSVPRQTETPAAGGGGWGVSDPNADNGGDSGGVTATCRDMTDTTNDPFVPWWNTVGSDQFFSYAQNCGPKVILESEDAYLQCIRDEPYNYAGSDECLNCFTLPVGCIMEHCLGMCLASGVESVGCIECLVENDCAGPFEDCAGVSVDLSVPEDPDADAGRLRRRRLERSLQEGGGDEGGGSTQLYEVYSISFVDSVRDAANGGAYVLVVFLVALSGIWPYLKNVIMMVAWFVPMTTRRRGKILQWLTRFAKWSLVDVFVVVIICAGVRIDKGMGPDGDFRLVLVGEPRVGIITFCIAAMWDLSQGEWMRTKHFEMMHRTTASAATAAAAVSGAASGAAAVVPSSSSSSPPVPDPRPPLLRQVRYRNGKRGCSAAGRALYAFVVLAQLALLGAIFAVLCVTFTLGGFPPDSPGTNVYEYTAVTVATSLLSNYGTVSPGGTTAFVGTIFVVVVYLMMCLILPLLQCLLMSTASLVPAGVLGLGQPRRMRSLFTAVDISGGFSCLDVFLLAFILCAIEFNSLMESALNEIVGDLCERGGMCLSLSSTIEIGVLLSIPAVVLGWIVEANFSYLEAYFVHPSEMFPPWNWFFGLPWWTFDAKDSHPENYEECEASA